MIWRRPRVRARAIAKERANPPQRAKARKTETRKPPEKEAVRTGNVAVVLNTIVILKRRKPWIVDYVFTGKGVDSKGKGTKSPGKGKGSTESKGSGKGKGSH